MKKIIRVATHLGSLGKLLEGQLQFTSAHYKMIGVGSEDTSAEGKRFAEELSKKENARIIPVEMTREITPFKDLQALYNLYKLFKKEQPFIVHSHTPKAGTLSMIAAKMAKVPHRLHTVAGLPLVEATGNKRKILNYVEKITYACATKVYPNSFGLKDIILNNNFTSPKKLKVIGAGSSNGIDTSFFNPSLYTEQQNNKLRETLSIGLSDFVFVFLGRIVKDKGINELIEAFKLLAKNHHQAKLLLVGYYNTPTADLFPETEKEIATNNNIILLDWQHDVRPFLSIANVLTFPSYREGFPNTVLQASAMKVPSIVANINGCNEIIKEGVNGTIIPVKNTEALHKSMQKLLLNTNYYTNLVANARKPICDNYERKHLWQSLLNEYKTLSKN